MGGNHSVSFSIFGSTATNSTFRTALSGLLEGAHHCRLWCSSKSTGVVLASAATTFLPPQCGSPLQDGVLEPLVEQLLPPLGCAHALKPSNAASLKHRDSAPQREGGHAAIKAANAGAAAAAAFPIIALGRRWTTAGALIAVC